MVKYASTFLCHSSGQKPLVERVAESLQQLGVIAWLDKANLSVGSDLSESLRRATAEQITVTAFLSEQAMDSPWVQEELEPRLLAASPNGDAIVPVYLGDPLHLVLKSRLLRERWLSNDQRRVDRLGVVVRGDEGAETIALTLASDLFRRIEIRAAPRVLIALDQRGHGPALGVPDDGLVPPNWARASWPGLVFRTSSGERSPDAVLYGEAWVVSRLAMRTAIARALGTHTQREIYIAGRGQLAFAWLIGTLVDRSTLARLIVRNPQSSAQLDLDQGAPEYRVPAPPREVLDVEWTPRPSVHTDRTISIALMAARYQAPVHAFRAEAGDLTPLAVRETGLISSIEEVIELQEWVADVARGRDIRLYTGLPFHVLVFIAALSKHAIGNVTLMEYDLGARTYRACEI